MSDKTAPRVASSNTPIQVQDFVFRQVVRDGGGNWGTFSLNRAALRQQITRSARRRSCDWLKHWATSAECSAR
jgi:hypothetical protein